MDPINCKLPSEYWTKDSHGHEMQTIRATISSTHLRLRNLFFHFLALLLERAL